MHLLIFEMKTGMCIEHDGIYLLKEEKNYGNASSDSVNTVWFAHMMIRAHDKVSSPDAAYACPQ